MPGQLGHVDHHSPSKNVENSQSLQNHCHASHWCCWLDCRCTVTQQWIATLRPKWKVGIQKLDSVLWHCDHKMHCHPGLNLKVGKMNYGLGNLDPDWAKCSKSGQNFSRNEQKKKMNHLSHAFFTIKLDTWRDNFSTTWNTKNSVEQILTLEKAIITQLQQMSLEQPSVQGTSGASRLQSQQRQHPHNSPDFRMYAWTFYMSPLFQ